MPKRIIHGLVVNKIAAVDFPCQEHAVAAIMKSRPVVKALQVWSENGTPVVKADTTQGTVLRKSLFEAIEKSGLGLTDNDADGAQLFDAVLGAEKLTQQFWDAYYKGTCALQDSLSSIVKDDTVTDKAGMVEQSLKEFADYIGEILPNNVGKALVAGIAATFAGSARNGENLMSDALKKALGLPTTATEAEMLKALETRDGVAKGLVAPMSDAQVAYLAKMKDPAEIADFQKADATARDKKMKDDPKDDPNPNDVEKAISSGEAFRTLDGSQVVYKSKVGADTFSILKSMDDGRRGDRAEIEKGREDRIVKEYEDLAAANGFAKEFAPTLRKAMQGSAPEARDALLKEYKALKAQADAGGVFSEFGKQGDKTAGSATAELMAKRDELKKSQPTLSNEQAFSRVYKARENAALVAKYKAELATAN
jgi:hypothetical protein